MKMVFQDTGNSENGRFGQIKRTCTDEMKKSRQCQREEGTDKK